MDTNEVEYEIIFGKPETINSGKPNVVFNQRKVSIKHKSTGQITDTPINVGSDSENFAADLVWEWFSKKSRT